LPSVDPKRRATKPQPFAQFFDRVAAAWMGRGTVVGGKHYWRVTDADYDRAIQKAQQKASQDMRIDRQGPEQKSEKPGDFESHRVPMVDLVLPVGTEQPSESAGKVAIPSSDAAQNAAVDAGQATVINAWPVLAPHCRSIIVGMARKAILKAAADRT
jgi:hypothetical protein